MRGKTEGIKQPSGWRTTSDWNLHSKAKLPKNIHLFLLTGISQKTHPIKHDWENPPKGQLTLCINILITELEAAFLSAYSFLRSTKSQQKIRSRNFSLPVNTDTDRFTLHSINTSSRISFTFWWSLGRKHSLLLSFGGWIHTSGRRIVVGWSIVHIRPSSANVHTWKR